MGQRLIPGLLSRGHEVRALVRPGSEQKVPAGSSIVVGNALDAGSFASSLPPAETFVQLVGVAHPNPTKADQFRIVDLPSMRASLAAAVGGGVRHFVYVSVAQPAPVMKAYVQVRAECEDLLRASGLDATILRPWYVLGPGHRWPYLLWPFYWLAERLPATRESALRLGLVSLKQMIAALVIAVENPVPGIRIVNVPEIRASGLQIDFPSSGG